MCACLLQALARVRHSAPPHGTAMIMRLSKHVVTTFETCTSKLRAQHANVARGAVSLAERLQACVFDYVSPATS